MLADVGAFNRNTLRKAAVPNLQKMTPKEKMTAFDLVRALARSLLVFDARGSYVLR